MHANNNTRTSTAEFEKEKPSVSTLLNYIESDGIEAGIASRPGLLAKLCRHVGAEGPFRKGVYDRFLKYYWAGIGILVSRSPTAQALLAETMALTVNLEATDAPLHGHFLIQEGKISGGPQMLAFSNQDLRYFGPTNVLMKFLNNELPLGYADLSLHSEGHPGLGKILFPVMRTIARLAKGDDASQVQ
jgi:hypothetical protein